MKKGLISVMSMLAGETLVDELEEADAVVVTAITFF